MEKFLKNILLFLGLCVILDYFGAFLLKQLRPIDYGAFIESREDFFKSDKTYDVLFIGDSHIADALNVKAFEVSCGLTAYNLGIYHASPFDNYFLLKKIIGQGKIPQYIVLGTNPAMFYNKANPSKYLYSILNDRIMNIQMNLKTTEKFDGFSLLKFSNEKYLIPAFFKKIKGEKYTPTREVKSVYNGFLEFYNQTSNLDWTNFKISTGEVNDLQVQYFSKIIELAQKNNIRIVLFNPPIWKNKLDAYENEGKYFSAFNSCVSKTKVKYKLPLFNETHRILDNKLTQTDFLNPDHLNCSGATKISNEFIIWFKTYRHVKE